jgi:hypothetical protein
LIGPLIGTLHTHTTHAHTHTHTRHIHTTLTHDTDAPRDPTSTGNKPLTSPATNIEFKEEQSTLAPNVFVRGLVLEYTAAQTREWEAAERRWREQGGEQQG